MGKSKNDNTNVDPVKAAEVHPDNAKETNPVGEATRGESIDPYAAGQHINNPEPNNTRPDADAEKEEKEAVEEQAELDAKSEEMVEDQEAKKAKK